MASKVFVNVVTLLYLLITTLFEIAPSLSNETPLTLMSLTWHDW